jgi:hypothetical protein
VSASSSTALSDSSETGSSDMPGISSRVSHSIARVSVRTVSSSVGWLAPVFGRGQSAALGGLG